MSIYQVVPKQVLHLFYSSLSEEVIIIPVLQMQHQDQQK